MRTPSRSLLFKIAFIVPVLDELSVSGMALLGTTPYLRSRLTNMFHWPPSLSRLPSNQWTVRSSAGRSAVSRIASRK